MTDKILEDSSTKVVFERVSSNLESSDAARSLWIKLEQEMESGGVSAAASYLHSRFSELAGRTRSAVNFGENS